MACGQLFNSDYGKDIITSIPNPYMELLINIKTQIYPDCILFNCNNSNFDLQQPYITYPGGSP